MDVDVDVTSATTFFNRGLDLYCRAGIIFIRIILSTQSKNNLYCNS